MSDLNPEVPVPEEYPAGSAPPEPAAVVPPPADDDEGPSRIVDPAFVYIIVLAVTLLGLGTFEPDVRATLVWVVLTVVALFTLIVDKLDFLNSRPGAPDLFAGLFMGALVGVPLMAIGGPQLKLISGNIFGKSGNVAVFNMVAFTMPIAETLFFRGAMQSARSLIFTGLAAGIWSVVLMLPQLNIAQYPLVALIIAISFLLINFLYSYLRERFGIYTAWACQITINVLLLFATRFF